MRPAVSLAWMMMGGLGGRARLTIGKDALSAEVITLSGAVFRDRVRAVLDASPDAPTGITTSFAGAAELLVATDFADACPIETIALEVARTHESLRGACASVFDDWLGALTAWFGDTKLPADVCRSLALSYLCALEGAFVLCRTLRSVEPLQAAADGVRRATQDALASA